MNSVNTKSTKIHSCVENKQVCYKHASSVLSPSVKCHNKHYDDRLNICPVIIYRQVLGSIKSSRSHNLCSFIRWSMSTFIHLCSIIVCLDFSICRFLRLFQVSLKSLSETSQLTLKNIWSLILDIHKSMLNGPLTLF